MASGPAPGDLIIRNIVNGGFEIAAADGKFLAGPFNSFFAAYERAKVEARKAEVWQQAIDRRGKPLGLPGRMTAV